MARVTPDEFVEKHARRLKGALEDVRAGIQKVNVAPTQKAAAKKDKMLTNLTKSVNDGTWETRLKKVTLEQWKSKAADVGVNRIPAGIDAARDKVRDFASQLLPAVDAARSKISNMPDVTLEDNINRMTTYIREMSKFKKK